MLRRLGTVVLLAGLTLTGCGADPDGDESESGPDASAESSSAEGRPSGPSATVTVTDGEVISEITPTEVICAGQPGNLHHLIAKTDHQLPLVKVEPGGFVMVKLSDQRRPYMSDAPSGVEIQEDGVTFADSQLGSATVTGTLTCTIWNG